MIRDGMHVVELNDTGHISYMGLNGTTTNGKLMVQLRDIEDMRRQLEGGLVSAADQGPGYADEQSCAASILSAEVVQTLYKSLGTDPEIIRARLSSLTRQEEGPDTLEILRPRSMWRRHLAGLVVPLPLELGLLSLLLIHGTPAIKQALTPCEGKPGDVPFFVVRKRREAELQSLWPGLGEQTGNAVLLDDPFTSMKTVVDILQASFGMDPESANKRMLQVHKSGSCVLELDPGTNASDTCSRLNSEWRSEGLPLYCEPQRLSPTTRMVQ
jgi:ATP-dependent Clp protease adapter protein ClpS